jgi:hypothetical protein
LLSRTKKNQVASLNFDRKKVSLKGFIAKVEVYVNRANSLKTTPVEEYE